MQIIVHSGKNRGVIVKLCYIHNSIPKIPLKTPFSDGESLPAWHINGILAENERNVEGGKMQNIIVKL